MPRILSFLLLACALGAREAPPTPPAPVPKALRLKLEGFPAEPSLALDPKEITADLTTFLASQGIPVVPEGKEAPEGTFELEISAVTLQYPEGTCLLSVSEWLAPLAEKKNPAGNAQGWSGNFMAAQAGEAGLVYQARSLVLEMAAFLLHRAAGEAIPASQMPAPRVKADDPPARRPPAPLPPAIDAETGQAKVKVQPPAPPYPALALERKVEGTVVVLLTLDPDGRPARAVAAGGPSELKATALRYAMQWIFAPVKADGKPVWARVKLPIPFHLGN